MVRTARGSEKNPASLGFGTQSLTVFVEEVDPPYEHARSEGAKIVEEVNITIYGERQFGVVDVEGHHWLFAQHARDVAPEEWGARVANR